MRVSFTPKQKDIILHRLEVADAVADSLVESFYWLKEERYDPFTHIVSRVEYLAVKLEGSLELYLHDELDRAIVVDAIEGSTYLESIEDAVASAELSQRSAKAYARAYDDLVSWVESLKALGASE
jgi:hypothetical protein